MFWVDEVAGALLFAVLAAFFIAPTDSTGAWPHFVAQARQRLGVVLVVAVFAIVAGGLAVVTALFDLDRGSRPRSRRRPETPLQTTRADRAGKSARSGRADLWALLVTALVFIWTTIDVMTAGPLRVWDRDVIGVAPPAGAAEPFGWRLLADVGGAAFLCAVLIAAAAIHLLRGRRVRPVLVAGLWIVAIEGLIWLTKVTIGRTPPRSTNDLVFHGGMSFPSGHTADAVALLLIAAALATTRGSVADRATAWIVPLVAAGVAVSTVQLHYHWPTDAIAGWALGLAAGTLARQSVRRNDRQGQAR